MRQEQVGQLLINQAAVLGTPIAHSLSPALHNAAYRALGLNDWRYTAIECDEDHFAALVADLDDSWRGLSCTMPLKHVAATVATTMLRRPDGSWHAENTDVDGILAAVAAVGEGPPREPVVVVLGAGGTALA